MWVAHSAPPKNVAKGPQPYGAHVANVRTGAGQRADEMLSFLVNGTTARYRATLDFAAEYHDLGKLDDGNQRPLQSGRGSKLEWDHIDAGVAHSFAENCSSAAWIIRAHHSPGLASAPDEDFQERGALRGKRHRGAPGSHPIPGFHDAQVNRTDDFLSTYLERHRECSPPPSTPGCGSNIHGLDLRLLLSCLVDADHSDSAMWDCAELAETRTPVDWALLIEHLDAYVSSLGRDVADEKVRLRNALYTKAKEWNCGDDRIFACEANVGLGKTTALVRYLLARMRDEGLRHLFIVAPYTTILRQTANVLRRAWGGLAIKDPVAEHHHRAEFSDISSRQYSALWRAPVTLTSTVQFFETLASSSPRQLRKLHELPGSAIFLDEAHVALPPRLWPQGWRWLRHLTGGWSCRVALASGSMVRFWERPEVISPPEKLPELTPADVASENRSLEKMRVTICSIEESINTGALAARLCGDLNAQNGPVLVILNTVQSAAALAAALARLCDIIEPLAPGETKPLRDRRILQLSTALSPSDRDSILKEIERRSRERASDWVLVATSCVEAGIDLDFQTGYRERCSVASLIQTSGRINRHNRRDGAHLYDFQILPDGLLTHHPAFKTSANIVGRLWSQISAGLLEPAELMTQAMMMELNTKGEVGENGQIAETIQRNEAAGDYPAVAQDFRLIQTDTRTVIVDKEVAARLVRRDKVTPDEILLHSVQLWSDKINKLGLEPMFQTPLSGSEIYCWNAPYDQNLLGIMQGLLPLAEMNRSGILIVENIE